MEKLYCVNVFEFQEKCFIFFLKKIEKVINLTIFHTFQHICAFVKLSMKYITAILLIFLKMENNKIA